MKTILPIVLLFLVLAVLSAHVNLPGTDEAWFASPAVNLITRGTFGTSVLDPTAAFRQNNLTGITQHTYWTVPLYGLVEAAWYSVVGFGLMHQRYLSAVWGLVAMWAWFRILMIACGDRRIATLAIGLISVDFTVILASSWGRMDMMAAALGSTAMAAYLSLREKSLIQAVLASHSCVAAAGLSHPMALGYFAGMLALTLYRDWRRIRIPHVLVACVPYLVGAVGWGLYISEAPHDWVLQFSGNAAGRTMPLSDPTGILFVQFVKRFWYMFGMAPDTRGLSHSKLLILAVYVAGVAAVLLTREIRHHPGYRMLMLTGAVTLFTMMYIDNEAQSFYLVHFVLWMIAFTAIAAVWYWDRGALPRWTVAAALTVVVLVQLATIGRRVTQQAYASEYLPVTNYLKAHAQSKDIIMGSSELAFELGYRDNLVDDQRLGFRSGKRPNFIVIDRNRYAEWIPQFEQREPATYRYIRGMMDTEFHPVLQNDAYQVYARNGL